jgi:hypothetical protein
MIQNHRSEKGQAIVLLVVAVIAMLGFVALAIDGGMVYSDRRHAQNASDASALAGAGAAAMYMETKHIYYNTWSCGSALVQEAQVAAKDAARTRAGSNGFTIDYNLEDKNGVATRCEPGFFNGSWVEKYLEITTLISDTTETSFAQLIFSGALQNNVQAKTRVYPRSPLAFGNAIVSLNNNSDCSGSEGVVMGGSQTVTVNGGGIFSNGCMKCNGISPIVVLPEGMVNLSIQPPVNCSNMDPVPQTGTMMLPKAAVAIPEPDCSDSRAHNYSNEFKITNNEVVELDPGLHCFNNSPSALTMNGGTLSGTGVTIYAPNGSISITGGEAFLSAPGVSPDPYPALANVLFYTASSGNRGVITLVGNGNSTFTGTIYAPDSDIKVTGNSATAAFNTQLVGWNVNVDGNATLNVNFNDSLNFKRPAVLELFK